MRKAECRGVRLKWRKSITLLPSPLLHPKSKQWKRDRWPRQAVHSCLLRNHSDWCFWLLFWNRLWDESRLRMSPLMFCFIGMLWCLRANSQRKDPHWYATLRLVIVSTAGCPGAALDRISWPSELPWDAWNALRWVSVFKEKIPSLSLGWEQRTKRST